MNFQFFLQSISKHKRWNCFLLFVAVGVFFDREREGGLVMRMEMQDKRERWWMGLKEKTK